MAGKLDVNLLRKAIRSAPAMVRRLLSKLAPQDVAPQLAELSPKELRIVVEALLHEEKIGAVLEEIPDDLLPEVLDHIDPDLTAQVLAQLEPDDAVRVASRLEDDFRQLALGAMEPAAGDQITRLLRYSPDSAGRRMIPSFVAAAPWATVGEAIHQVREAAPDVPLFYLYVVNNGGTLLGVVSLGQLVKTNDDVHLQDLMTKEILSVSPEADQEEVARLVVRTNLLAVPVVEDGLLVGLITVDDVIDVLQQEATEDMYNMAGLSEGDRVFSPPHRSLVKRLPWNALNLLTSMCAASVVALFENTIDKLVTLAVFMPVVAGIGGNTGNQTLTVIIRGIALGELEFSSALKAMAKEVVVGIGIGLLLGTLAAFVAFLWKGNAMLGVVVGMAMVANLFVAALAGTAIPLTLKRFGMDPALGGSILVTMCTDVFGFLSFLGLATLFMHYLL